MPIPPFNQYGLLPPEIHPASLEELVQKLGFSSKRQDLIEQGLKPVVERLKALGVREVYLNGSFTTSKPSPGDIDGYVLTTVGSALETEMAEHQEEWKATYRMDMWPAYTDQSGEMSQAAWDVFFGHTKEQPPKAKGIVKLILEGGERNVPAQE